MAAFVLVAMSLAIMLFRVASPYRAKSDGAVLYTISLNLRERMAMQRLNLCALGVILLLAAIGHWFKLPVELLIIAVAYGILLIPVRYVLTTSGIGVNQVLFRRWNEFADIAASEGGMTLIGHPGNGRLRLWVRAGPRQQELLRTLRRHVHASGRLGTHVEPRGALRGAYRLLMRRP